MMIMLIFLFKRDFRKRMKNEQLIKIMKRRMIRHNKDRKDRNRLDKNLRRKGSFQEATKDR